MAGLECGNWEESSGMELWFEMKTPDVIWGQIGTHTIEIEASTGNYGVYAIKIWTEGCDQECNACTGDSWRDCSSCKGTAQIVTTESGSYSWCECQSGNYMLNGEC